jgi:hypothetical protein
VLTSAAVPCVLVANLSASRTEAAVPLVAKPAAVAGTGDRLSALRAFQLRIRYQENHQGDVPEDEHDNGPGGDEGIVQRNIRGTVGEHEVENHVAPQPAVGRVINVLEELAVDFLVDLGHCVAGVDSQCGLRRALLASQGQGANHTQETEFSNTYGSNFLQRTSP